MVPLRAAALVVAVLVAGCHIEDRAPSGSRHDDDAIRSVLATYYQSLGTHNWVRSRELFADSATVEVRRTAPDSVWRDFRSPDAYHVYLSRRYSGARGGAIAVRMFRVDIRQQGDLATAWVVTRRRPMEGEGRDELGTADIMLLRRERGAWRILSYASTPDLPAAAH